MSNRVKQLFEKEGQSVWLDFIRRNMLKDGGMRRYVEEDGIRGVTANPTIFANAIGAGDDYDVQIEALLRRGVAPADLFEHLAVDDIRAACDILRPVYDASDGADGFVSIEVSPTLAFDTQGTIAEAKRWWQKIERPNLFVKIPATDEGVPAIEECLAAGININITLLFAVSYYERVMEAYLKAMERRLAAGEDLRVASVASFFVSRVDTLADKKLDEAIAAVSDDVTREALRSLQGKVAVANAKVAYRRFQEIFGAERFKALASKGARVQRPLWASTGTKNKAYSDTLYIDELIGPDTVNTMPPATIDAFRDHGVVKRTVDEDYDEATRVLAELDAVGISLEAITDQLTDDGVKAFEKSFAEIGATIDAKAAEIQRRVGAA